MQYSYCYQYSGCATPGWEKLLEEMLLFGLGLGLMVLQRLAATTDVMTVIMGSGRLPDCLTQLETRGRQDWAGSWLRLGLRNWAQRWGEGGATSPKGIESALPHPPPRVFLSFPHFEGVQIHPEIPQRRHLCKFWVQLSTMTSVI